MTRQQETRRRPNLTQTTIHKIRERISSGEYAPGEKLPPEPKMVAEFGVSRTVIREAIANLRADGLVEARHGVGVFVLDPPKQAAALRLFGEDPERISSVVETLELRAAVEIEAVRIAAQRCSPSQEIRIHECFSDMVNNVANGESTKKSDFEFHKAIAAATNNPQFIEFLDYLGRRTIPRAQFKQLMKNYEPARAYRQQLLDEHRAIMEAISMRDPERAQKAMRTHLKGSQERYRLMISSIE